MHYQLDTKEGRAIVPRARKSIHDHRGYCPIKLHNNMGRYGVPENADHGTDELDNAMGNVQPPSPLRTIKKVTRKKSLPTHNNQLTDDSVEEDHVLLLSKSLPASLPSYCSDLLELPPQAFANDPANSSSEPVYLNNSSNTSFNSSNNSHHSPMGVVSETSSLTGAAISATRSWSFISILTSAVLILGIAVNSLRPPVTNLKENRPPNNEFIFYREMDILGEEYKVSDTPVLKLKTGLSTIFEREDTGSFIFLYNSKNEGFDEIQFDSFVEKVATVAARYLRNDSETPVRHIVVKNLDMRTQGELISKYRYELEKNGVMLVKNLDEIPSNLAMAFHYYCDEYNPLAKKSAVFFTLDLAKCSNTSEQKSNTKSRNEKHSVIEKCMASKWSGVNKDNIKPLLTRVVSVVIDVSKAFKRV